MNRGDRIFVEFFIPPPPPRSSDSESSDSENQTSDGGIEISGIDKSQNILDISAAVVERANQETRKRSGKGRTVINVNSIFNQSGESDDYVDSPIPEEDASDSQNISEANPDSLFDLAPDQHLDSRSNSLDSNASAVSSTSEANSVRSASASQLKEMEEKNEPISISFPHASESHVDVRESVSSPKPFVEPKSSDPSIGSLKDLQQIHLDSTDESSSDRGATPLVSSDESEGQAGSGESDSELGEVDRKGDEMVHGKVNDNNAKVNDNNGKVNDNNGKINDNNGKINDNNGKINDNGKISEKVTRRDDEKPEPKSPMSKSPSSPRRSNDNNTHSPNTSLSPRGTQTIVEKVMSPRTEDEEPAERSHTRHSSPYEKTSSSSPMELAQDFMVMLNKSPTRSPNRGFFGSSPHGFISHSPQPLDDMSRVEEETTSPEEKGGSLERQFHLMKVETVSSTSGPCMNESNSSQENPLRERNTSSIVPKESNPQQSSVNDLLNESDQMAGDITGVDTPSLPSSPKESGTF